MLTAQATLRIYKCHMMRFGPIACRYFALSYNNVICLTVVAR